MNEKLHEAIKEGDIEAVKQQLADGADVNAKSDGVGRTPLDLAIHFKHPETADLLRKHGGKTGEELTAELIEAIEEGDIEAVKQAIAAGADVNEGDGFDNFPLHTAVWGGNKEIIALLIAEGADLNAENEGDRTPLDYAKGEIADLLRKHGGKTGKELA